MELTDLERKTLVESLIFAAAADACLNTDSFDAETALELAVKLNDPSLELDCYLYKGGDEYYEEISQKVEDQIPQIKVENI